MSHLALLVTHQDHAVRAEALRALARFGGIEARRAISAALDDPDRAVRLAAFWILREERDPSDPQLLGEIASRLDAKGRPWIDEEDKLELLRTVAALGGEDRLIDILPARSFFGSRKKSELRACAAHVLGERKCRRAAEPLRKLLSDRDPSVRASAQAALASLEEGQA